jgi:hypothetical protein
MVFITLCSKKVDFAMSGATRPRLFRLSSIVTAALRREVAAAVAWLRVFAVALIAALAAGSAVAADRIVVTEAELIASSEPDGGLVLNAQFEFELPSALGDALHRGIALYFVIEFELYRRRWYWLDPRVDDATLGYRLTYSPLTRQYRLGRGALAQPFDTLEEAMNTLRRLRNWKVLEHDILKTGDDYRAQIRMRLDPSQLPRPFQISALTQRDWALASDWRPVAVGARLR